MNSVSLRSVNRDSRGAIPRGFTLVELMVTLFVLAILLGIAVPSFRDAAVGSRVSSYANDLVASVHLARSEAIKRNDAVTLCASSDGATCEDDGGWEVGWVVLAADGTLIQRQAPLEDGYRMTEAAGTTQIDLPPTIIRNPPTTLSFTVCRGEPVGKQERLVTVSPTGTTAVRRTSAAVCPEAD
jgi:type IV fimbrial biogenesis protein FimT